MCFDYTIGHFLSGQAQLDLLDRHDPLQVTTLHLWKEQV